MEEEECILYSPRSFFKEHLDSSSENLNEVKKSVTSMHQRLKDGADTSNHKRKDETCSSQQRLKTDNQRRSSSLDTLTAKKCNKKHKRFSLPFLDTLRHTRKSESLSSVPTTKRALAKHLLRREEGRQGEEEMARDHLNRIDDSKKTRTCSLQDHHYNEKLI